MFQQQPKDTILQLLKLDLGITAASRDPYFISLVDAIILELKRKGIILIEEDDIEYCMLVSDYAAWRYRKRKENLPRPSHLTIRIRDRILKNRSIPHG